MMGFRDGAGDLSGDDVARLSDQVADLTAAGLPLAPGLRATAEEMARGRLRSAMLAMAEALDAGATVEEAVEAQGSRLPRHLRGIVLIGARTGRMSQVLSRFTAFLSVGAELRRRLWIALAYPTVSLAMAALIYAFVLTSLVRSVEGVFKDFGVPVPRITLLLIQLSHLLQVGGWALLDVLFGLVAAYLLFRFMLSAPMRRSLLGRVPAVGGVWRNTSLAEFCHLLGLLLESGVPLTEALRLTGDGVGDASVEAACQVMEKDVAAGLSLSDAVERQRDFPRGLSRLLGWAEKHRGLAESLHIAGEMFEARARARARVAGTVLVVLAVLSLLVGAIVIALGVMLPMITLISKLSG
jgi:type II secretory pathway component PulF